MAITTQISATKVANVRNPFTYTFSSDNSTQENFRFVLDVFSGTTGGTRIFRDKQSPIPSTNRVEFSPHGILKDYMFPVNIQSLTGGTSGQTYEMLNYSIQIGEEYGAGVTGTTLYPALKTVTGYCINSVATYQELPSWNYGNFIALSATTTIGTSRFLTNAPTTKTIRDNERETLSIILSGLPSIALDAYMFVKVYRYSGSALNYSHNISNLFAQPVGIKHFGVGIYNLNHTRAIPPVTIVNTETDYKYEVSFYFDTVDGSTALTETRTFLIDNTCSKYPTKRFMFQNRLGSRDYFTATLAERNTLKTESSTSRRVLASNYSLGDKNEFVNDVNAQESVLVHTNWLTDEDSIWLKELFTSRDVYELQEDGTQLPIIIENNSEEIKQRVNDKLIKYEIKYRYAFKYNT